MTEAQWEELEPAGLLGGPLDGREANLPILHYDVWLWVQGTGYCRYQRPNPLSPVFAFTQDVIETPERMLEFLERQTGLIEPWVGSC